MNDLFDVVIIGGGPAGSAAAIGLARLGRSVALIEKSQYDQTRIGETLPPAARIPLEQLDVWDEFLSDEHAPSPANLSAWGQSEVAENHFIFNPYGNGWHIDRARFDAMLARAAEESGARVARGTRVNTITRHDSGEWCVEVEGSKAIQARLLIDATGRAGFLSRQMGAKRRDVDRLVGLVAFFENGTHHDNRTLVEASEDGWWYSAFLPDSRHIVAYMTDADMFPKTPAQAAECFQNLLQLTVYTRERIGASRRPNPPLTEGRVRAWLMDLVLQKFSASSYINRPVVGKSWLAVGDAAFAFDPLSSQGIYHALESGLRAAQAVDQHFAGAADALQLYVGWAEKRFETYLEKRKKYYQLEQRWVDSTFWRRRVQ